MDHIILKFNIGRRRDFLLLKSIMEDHQDLAKYRERLNYKWGIVDSYDCKALALELIKSNQVDSEKVVIFGNSAGGLTAELFIIWSIFTAAICKYPVIDLKDMHYNTHRFEKDYLNSLVGNYAKNHDDYINRSPINHINKIKKPILLFHGKKIQLFLINKL